MKADYEHAARAAHPAIDTARLTCTAAPVQLDGTLTDGRVWYFRGRGDTVAVGVGATLDDAVAETVGLGDRPAVERPDDDAGWLEPDEVAAHLTALLAERLCPCQPGAPAHAHGKGGYAT